MTDRARRPGPTVRVRVHEETDGPVRHREDRVAAEEPLEIRLAWPGAETRRVWVTMRTPGHDFELAAGWLHHEGLIGPDGIREVAYCTDVPLEPEEELNVVTVTLAGPPATEPGHRHDASSSGSSACGVCGKDSVGEVLGMARGPAWTGPRIPPAVVRGMPGLLRSRQQIFERTGGVHGAALVDAGGEVLVVREDVGRHNAVDKVTGARLLAGLSPAEACLVVSGRAGFELVQKAVACGTGALAAVGAPSSLAVRLARESGLDLYGFVSADRCVRYTV